MTQKRISVVIPVYNGQKYIRRCIDSVLNQEGFDAQWLDIILINDGSNDTSLDILKTYEGQHPSIIRVFNQENAGVASTRNRGISLASGKYVAFIDQDDFIDRDFCSIMYTEAEAGDYDVICSGMRRPDSHGRIITSTRYADTYFARFMCMSVWAKIHKTEFLRSSKIKLFDNRHGEDIMFSFEVAQRTEKIKCINYAGYNWFYNDDSVSNTTQRGLDDANIKSVLNIQNKLAAVDVKKDNISMFFVTMITAYYIFFVGKTSTPGEFMNGLKELMLNLKTVYPNYNKNPYLWVAPRGILPIFSIGVKVFMVMDTLKIMGVFARFYCKGKEQRV